MYLTVTSNSYSNKSILMYLVGGCMFRVLGWVCGIPSVGVQRALGFFFSFSLIKLLITYKKNYPLYFVYCLVL
jgi:hypothetical protein